MNLWSIEKHISQFVNVIEGQYADQWEMRAIIIAELSFTILRIAGQKML